MPGPSTFRSAATKRSRRRSVESQTEFKSQLVAHAKTLYREQGYEAVSIRAVTDAFGMSPMSFYGYFASKQDLIKHIWLDFFGELLERLLAAGNGRRTPLQVIEAHARTFIDYWETHPDRYRMVYLPDVRLHGNAPFGFDDESVYRRLFTLTRERVQACAAGRPMTEKAVRMTMDLMFVKALGYLHGVLAIERYRFGDPAALRRAVVQDIVAMVAGAHAAA